MSYVYLVEHREYLWTEHGDSVMQTVVMYPASNLERAERWMANEAKRRDPAEDIAADLKRGRVGWYVVTRDMVDNTEEGTACAFLSAYDLYGRKLPEQPTPLPNPAAATVALERKVENESMLQLLDSLSPQDQVCRCPCHTGASHMIHIKACCGPGTGLRSPMTDILPPPTAISP